MTNLAHFLWNEIWGYPKLSRTVPLRAIREYDILQDNNVFLNFCVVISWMKCNKCCFYRAIQHMLSSFYNDSKSLKMTLRTLLSRPENVVSTWKCKISIYHLRKLVTGWLIWTTEPRHVGTNEWQRQRTVHTPAGSFWSHAFNFRTRALTEWRPPRSTPFK